MTAKDQRKTKPTSKGKQMTKAQLDKVLSRLYSIKRGIIEVKVKAQ